MSSIQESNQSSNRYQNDQETEDNECTYPDADADQLEEEEISPAQLIVKLQQCWLNEKWAPELLEHQTIIIEYVIEQIKFMEKNIRSARKGDFRIAIHKLELDRIKFMLHSYLRIRLKKIEQFTSAILEEDQMKRQSQLGSKLSPEEFAYATEYHRNVNKHLKESILDRLPPNLRDINEAALMPKPDLDKFVFLSSLANLRGILIDEDLSSDGSNEILDMEKNDLFITRYRPIKNHVQSEKIQLI